MKECQDRQCCAFASDNTRCTNTVVHGNYHCDDHYETATKLYKNYKTICKLAYNLEINKQIYDTAKKIAHVEYCYFWLNKAFYARMKHRRYAFVPECFNEGHNYQFEFIKSKILECEKILEDSYSKTEIVTHSRYYNRFSVISDQSDQSDLCDQSVQHESDSEQEGIEERFKEEPFEEDDSLSKTSNESCQNLKMCTENRNNTEEAVNKYLEKYISENNEILSRRRKLVTMMLNIIKSMVNNNIINEGRNELVFAVAINNMGRKLYDIGYFCNRFVARKCLICDCNEYAPYDITLGCNCSTPYDDAKTYFSMFAEYRLKKLYKILLFGKEKLIPIVKDFLLLHKIFEDQILFLDLEFSWSRKLKRLVLQYSDIPTVPQKPSSLLTTLRTKKQHLGKKLHDHFTTYETISYSYSESSNSDDESYDDSEEQRKEQECTCFSSSEDY